jgi:hypothetical protein
MFCSIYCLQETESQLKDNKLSPEKAINEIKDIKQLKYNFPKSKE